MSRHLPPPIPFSLSLVRVCNRLLSPTVLSPVLWIHVSLLFPLGCIGSKKVTTARVYARPRVHKVLALFNVHAQIFLFFFFLESNIVDNFGQL